MKSKEIIDLYAYENKLYSEGYGYIGGTDEAGRGPLYGPVVAACCVLPKGFILEGLNDSKQLSEKKRNMYINYIKENAIAYGIGIVSAKEIDEINIYEASRKAMMMAINEVKKKINMDYVLTDAMPLPELDIPHLPIIKGDAKSITIAAASVIAKVTRDEMLYEIDKKYPEYGFAKHKGYPTKAHVEAINKYGLIEGYRKSYGPVKEILERKI
jgi:ribonuclease HII